MKVSRTKYAPHIQQQQQQQLQQTRATTGSAMLLLEHTPFVTYSQHQDSSSSSSSSSSSLLPQASGTHPLAGPARILARWLCKLLENRITYTHTYTQRPTHLILEQMLLLMMSFFFELHYHGCVRVWVCISICVVQSDIMSWSCACSCLAPCISSCKRTSLSPPRPSLSPHSLSHSLFLYRYVFIRVLLFQISGSFQQFLQL